MFYTATLQLLPEPIGKGRQTGGPKLSSTEPESNNTLFTAAIVIIVGVIATTLAQPQVLARIPLQNLLKNELHVDRSANAAFFFWAGLAWYFKPFAGIITDAFPIFGSRRKSYILISTTLAVLSWLGLCVTPHEYSKLLWMCIVINAFMVVASTVIGGYMVETAQAKSASGRLTAVRQFVQQGCSIINGPSAGYLASIAFTWTALACGGVMFLLVPVTILFLHEQRKRIDSRQLLENAGKQLANIGTAKTMFLQLIAGVCGGVASVGYASACRRFNLRTLLLWCMGLGAVANFSYLFYSSVSRAQAIEGINGFGYTLAELALMDLAIRATPAGSEGLGFSLMMSVRNLALFGTDWFGAKLLEQYHLSFDSLVIANAATTLITVPLVLLLPRVLVSKKDAEL